MSWFPLKHSTELFFTIASTWYIFVCKHVASKKFRDKLKIYKKKCEEKGNSVNKSKQICVQRLKTFSEIIFTKLVLPEIWLVFYN